MRDHFMPLFPAIAHLEAQRFRDLLQFPSTQRRAGLLEGMNGLGDCQASPIMTLYMVSYASVFHS